MDSASLTPPLARPPAPLAVRFRFRQDPGADTGEIHRPLLARNPQEQSQKLK